MKFSVLLSLYDKENPLWLDECLNSLTTQQTLVPNEIVIVEDGPINDCLSDILSKYQRDSVVCLTRVKLENNVGLGEALNIGLKKCKHELVARMDTDDIALPSRFERQVNFLLDNPGVDILGSSAIEIDEYSNASEYKRKVPEKNKEIYEYLWTCPILHPTVMFKKSFIMDVGSYSKFLKRRQDYELWFRCAKNNAVFHNLQEPLLKYRITAESHKKNSLKVALLQARIGLNGSLNLKLGLKAYIGVFYPVLKPLLPSKIRCFIMNKLKRFDPRS